MAVRSAIKREKKKKKLIDLKFQMLPSCCVRTVWEPWRKINTGKLFLWMSRALILRCLLPRNRGKQSETDCCCIRRWDTALLWFTGAHWQSCTELPSDLTLCFLGLTSFFFLLTLKLSRTPMPFRLVSPVSNADMNLPGDKGPNYSRGLIVHRLTVSNCPPSVKPGTENV